jgi:hypothetical protein
LGNGTYKTYCSERCHQNHNGIYFNFAAMRMCACSKCILKLVHCKIFFVLFSVFCFGERRERRKERKEVRVGERDTGKGENEYRKTRLNLVRR